MIFSRKQVMPNRVHKAAIVLHSSRFSTASVLMSIRPSSTVSVRLVGIASAFSRLGRNQRGSLRPERTGSIDLTWSGERRDFMLRSPIDITSDGMLLLGEAAGLGVVLDEERLAAAKL